MTAMPNSLGRFRAVVGAGWALLGLGAWIYARMKGIPEWAALPGRGRIPDRISILSASGVRKRHGAAMAARQNAPQACRPDRECDRALSRYTLSPPARPALIPFFALLPIMAAVFFWYLILPAAFATDLLFIPAFSRQRSLWRRCFDRIYLSLIPGLSISHYWDTSC